MARIVRAVGDDRFGPNSAQVDALLERLRHLTSRDWEKLIAAAPSAGSIPDLELRQAPEYFRALDAATRIAKSEVFPGSESAFYEAMRQAQLAADGSATGPSDHAGSASATMSAEEVAGSPEAEAEALTRLMSTAYEEEGRRRVINACMMAAGGLVVRDWLARSAFERLYTPVAAALELKGAAKKASGR